MKRFIMLMIALMPLNAFAWDNPHFSPAGRFLSVPHDKKSVITLESGRVKSINGAAFIYSTGKDELRIRADSPASRRFLKEVREGRVSAREQVTLEPERKSPFNTIFKAARFHFH